jgi:hypothetical protein
MRPIILAVCVFAAACSGQDLGSPASPTTALVAPGQTAAQSGTQVPFRGSLTTFENVVIDPPNLLSDGTAQGIATHIGRFTATFAVVVVPPGTGTGTITFTAANGDQLSATFTGQGVEIEPGVAGLTEVATIVGGTGRFAPATGTFNMNRIIRFDEAGNASGTGSFEGHINLNK